MPFEVIPAIDLWHGRLARMSSSEAEPIDAFGGDPLAAARAFADAGAGWVHVVDLDLAFTGEPGNLDAARAIAEIGVRVQASGGIGEPRHVKGAFDAGAARVVLGSAALADRALAESLIQEHGHRLAVALEVEGRTLRPRGRSEVELSLDAVLEWLRPARFVHTGVGRVGGLAGPDLEGVAAVAARTGRPVIASGGVASLEHLRELADTPGVEGAVIGRALYDGEVDLAEALRLRRE